MSRNWKIFTIIGMTLIVLALAAGILYSQTQDSTTPDYSAYKIIDVQEVDLLAGAGQSAAHLSPDGTRFIHILNSTFCLYELGGDGIWSAGECHDVQMRENGSDRPDEMRWSPDNRWLTLPTYENAIKARRDTDIRVLDLETFTMTVATEDETDLSLLQPAYDGFLDMSPSWIDADTLLFVRYVPEVPHDGRLTLGAPHLMTLDLPDGTPEELAVLPDAFPASVYAITLSGDGAQIAYAVDNHNTASGQGVWTMQLDDLMPEMIMPLEAPSPLPVNLDYSADSRYLLLFNEYQPFREDSIVSVLDIANQSIIEIDPARTVIAAAWSPQGNALAYAVYDELAPENNGLYLTSQPGEPGRLILQDNLRSPNCCGLMPMEWAPNDTILLARSPGIAALVVKLGDK